MVLVYCRKGMVGQLFDSDDKLLWGLTVILGP
jgi:hypothetical protein